MSQTRKFKSVLIAIFSIFAFFAFGCEKEKVAVNKIDIRLESQQQVVMLVDEFFNLGEHIEVSPNYATDKTFTIYSLNESVVRVVGNQLKAIAAGETLVRVVANTNENVEDVILVTVYDEQLQLSTPTNLKYNSSNQTFTFNAVDNAASYTVSINDREFNVGNVPAFELLDYVGEKYNNVLTVKVRANTSNYSKAFANSNYGQELKIYQTEKVSNVNIRGGKLSYVKNPNLTYDIYFNDAVFIQNASNEVDLSLLDEGLAGLTKNVSIIANASDEIKLANGNDVVYVPSKSDEMVLNILDEPDAELVGGIVSWDAIPFTSGYVVYYKNSILTETEKNFCDLKEFGVINFEDAEVEIRVESKLDENSSNIAKTIKKGNSVKFSRLATPILSIVNNSIEWQTVENASSYFIQVKNGNNIEFAGSTTLTNLDFSKLPAATYSVEVSAISNNSIGNFISSETATISFVKHAQTQAEIEDYKLKITTVENEKYLVNFKINDSNTYNETLTAAGDSIEVDLSSYNFKAGSHDIKITRLGNGTNSIDGELKVVSFTQLEAVTVSISNSTASVVRSSINKDAIIYLETTSTVLAKPIKIETISYKYNTTDLTKENCLSAGEYKVVAYVKGNGSSTFSVRDVEGENKIQTIACGEKTFTVLAVPSLSVLDKSKAEVSINKVNYATNYSILDESELVISNVNEKYAFNLASGEVVKLRVRANGNGSSTLTSLSSEVLTVKRLATPELTFDANNNSFALIANNDSTLYDANATIFSYNNGATEYTFGETFTGLKVGDNNFKVSLVSKGEVDGVYYINSLTSQINVYKLSNALNASVGLDNKLKIENSENGNLVVKIDNDETEYLAENDKIAGLDYVKSSNEYIITLLGSDYKAIIPSMADGFAIKAKFVRSGFVLNSGIKRYYTSSEWSDECNLTLTKLTTVAKIYSNTDNKIVIENPNSEKLYLDLILNVNGAELKFADNGMEQVVCSASGADVILPYTYSANKYYVDLYEFKNIKLDAINQGDSFDVKVQLKKSIAGSDIDSAISSSVLVTYLKSPTFERVEQNLSFVSTILDYGLDKYKLLVNNSTSISLQDFASDFVTSDEVGGLTKYTIPMVDLWNSLKTEISGFNKINVNSLRIVILNSATTQDNNLLGSLGDAIYVQQASSFTVATRKTDGLTSVEVQSVVTDYSKTYAIDVLGYAEYANNDGSVIRISLDDKEFSGDLNIQGYIKASSNYLDDLGDLDSANDRIVYVFDSEMSNCVTISRLAAPTLSVSNNKINYTTISGANDYEVYLLSGGGYLKVEESRLNRYANSFMFNDLNETEEFTIKVKATSTNSVVLNSNLSSEITIKKIGKATASIINGKVGIYLPAGCVNVIESGIVDVKLVLNLNGRAYECFVYADYSTSISGITWSASNNAFMVDSNLIFDYTDDYIVEKMLSVGLELNGAYDNKYYLYSDVWQTQAGNGVKALFAPTNINLNKNDTNFDTITWENNEKNKLSLSDTSLVSINQYVFVFIYEGKPYYSTDVCLKYLSGTNYISYGSILGTNTPFPYGYDANNDGDFEDSEDVIFAAGEYKVGIAAYTDGYVTSPYSDMYIFRALPTTVLSINDGKLVWDEIPDATSYVVRISGGGLSSTVIKYINALTYDFEDFDTSNNLFEVTVQAITDKQDILNSKESEPLSFYRLKTASKVEVDDGLIKITGTPFAYAIDIEYNGKTYRLINGSQEDNLKSAGLNILHTNDAVYGIDLAYYFPNLIGTSGTIKVRMCGNTGTKDLPIVGTVGIVNSKTLTNSNNVTVLNLNVNTVKSGVWQFEQNAELGTKTKAKINYNFNNVVNVHPFWLDTVVYEISINVYNKGSEETHIIYAVDYNRFETAVNNGSLKKYEEDTSAQTYYELVSDKNGLYARIVYKYKDASNVEKLLYFNVYRDNVKDLAGENVLKGNIINLQDYDVLYYSAITYEKFAYVGLDSFSEVNLANGGSFVVNIKTLGGDNGYTNLYLNSCNFEQKFVRFGITYAATKEGQLVFTNMAVEGSVSPVYKIGVYRIDGNIDSNVYLYDKTQCEVVDVRKKFGLTEDVICVPIEFVDGTELVTFDLGKYFDLSVCKIDVRAMAGIGADDFLLNAKKPTVDDRNTIHILNAPQPIISNGNIEFDLSFVNYDGSIKYTEEYEIVVKFGEAEYKEELRSLDFIVKQVRDGNETKQRLTYILPSSIGGFNITNTGYYEFKIRALSNDAGVINSPYYDNDGNGDDYIRFTRQNSVSNVKIEDGKLKWIGDSSSSKYLIKIYNNNNSKTIFDDDSGSYYVEDSSSNLFAYEIKDYAYQIWGEGVTSQILSDINYTFSVSRVGNNSTISSIYESCANVYRLSNVNAEQFIANAGLLTWQQVEDNNGYEITMENQTTHMLYSYLVERDVTFLDLSAATYNEKDLLPAGNYKAYIRAKGSDKINSLKVESLLTFKKLEKVSTCELNGSQIAWNDVENAQGYKVTFVYTNASGVDVSATREVAQASINAPTDVDGKLTIVIQAISTSSNILNSDKFSLTTSNAAPRHIYDLKYIDELNRFEWKVYEEDFTDSDNLFISYNFVEFTKDGNKTDVEIKILLSNEQNEYYNEETGIYNWYKQNYYDASKGVYYLPITIMGKYTNFKIAVQRQGTIDAVSTPIEREVSWFIYGAGTIENPYAINGEQSLINIKYYPKAYYKLVNNINIDTTKTYLSAILNFEFMGVLDGNNNKINLGNINLSNVYEFAIFKSLNGASLYNLVVQGNVINTISSQINQDVKIALLAIQANKSTFNNVKVLTSSISVKEEVVNSAQEIVGNLYISGLIARDDGSSLTSCRVDAEVGESDGLNISVSVDLSKDIYIGAVSAYGIETYVDYCEVKMEVENTKTLIKYLGGVFGRFYGNETRSSGVFNSTVEFTINNINALYVGGIVGYAELIKIENNTVTANITYTQLTVQIYIGGVAGVVDSGLLISNTVTGISVSLQTSSEESGIGLIAGLLLKQDELSCELIGSYPGVDSVTIIETNIELTLGLCGKVTTGVVITNTTT